MIGQRLPDGLPDPWPALSGSYWFMDRCGARTLHGLTPNGLFCCLANHTVIENDDGTVTVTPSILVHQTRVSAGWHGYLEHGVWRQV